MKKIIFVIGLGFVLLVSVLLIRTARLTSKRFEVQPVAADILIDGEQIAQRLAGAAAISDRIASGLIQI